MANLNDTPSGGPLREADFPTACAGANSQGFDSRFFDTLPRADTRSAEADDPFAFIRGMLWAATITAAGGAGVAALMAMLPLLLGR